MRLYRRKNTGDIWQMDFSANGQRFQRSTGTADRKLAEQILAKVTTQVIESKWFEVDAARHRTFDQLMERYMEEHSTINKTPGSSRRDRDYIKHLSRVFGGSTLDKLCTALVSEYKALRSRDGAAPATIKNELVCLNHAINLAVKEWQWMRYNPIAGVKMPVVANKIDRWLDDAEEQVLFASMDDRPWLAEVVTFALNTGVRQGGIINLKWSDVDLFRRTAIIHKKSRMSKATYTIPLNDTSMDLLKAKSKVVNMSGYVFSQVGNEQLTKREVQRQFVTACKRAKVNAFRFHDLRHTFATRLVQAGVDLYTVSKLLGHASIKETERYAHHNPESIRNGVEKLDQLRLEKQAKRTGTDGQICDISVTL